MLTLLAAPSLWVSHTRAEGATKCEVNKNAFARVYNDQPYDRLHGYASANLSLTFADADGLDVMAYVKNLFNATAISGAFLNSDDTALTTNVFVTDPRLYGIRISKSL